MRAHHLLFSVVLLGSSVARAQFGDPSKVELKTTPVAGGVSMIEGANGFAGGNVGVSVGDDGVILIDDELQPMGAKLKAAVGALSKKPVRFVLNTHWHGDHTGGNAALGAAGAVIIAHDNVRKRLSVDQFVELMKTTIPASPPVALPVVTFGDDVTVHLNGDDIHAIHVPPAHTDGDVIIKFAKTNVIHAGDVFTAGYPLVDIGSGGKFDGFITAADKLLALSDDHTKFIPGHGPLMTRADLQAWRAMLVDLRAKVTKLMAAKKTLDQIKAAKPTAAYDAQRAQGFIKPDMIVEFIYKTAEKSPPRK